MSLTWLSIDSHTYESNISLGDKSFIRLILVLITFINIYGNIILIFTVKEAYLLQEKAFWQVFKRCYIMRPRYMCSQTMRPRATAQLAHALKRRWPSKEFRLNPLSTKKIYKFYHVGSNEPQL